ncbi:MAG: Fic family protein [Deltaproteobacteria bacterium]|nr:Fic family protein [Deltaproteobacteria bacterium]
MPRTYERTHPWLGFELDLRRFPAELWLLLGEARSKCEHLAGVPLRPETAKQLHALYLAKGVLATTAIEGNTLTEEQVAQHLDGKLQLPPSKQYLQTEIRNILGACNDVVSAIASGTPVQLDPATINDFNRRVLADLELREGVVPGAIRTYAVGVARYRGAPPEDCAYLLDRLTSWLRDLDQHAPAEMGMAMAMVRAVVAHLYIAWIHPYGDGNGRTARLVELAILFEAGVPAPAAHLLSNHYNETRSRYYDQLDRASRGDNGPVPFLLYAMRGLVDQLRQQVDRVREQQLDVAWRSHVHEQFDRLEKSATTDRRRWLLLDLSRQPAPVRRRDLMALTPRLAKAYATKTTKTLSRDINTLIELGLAIQEGGRVHARTEVIQAFLPVRRRASPPPASSTRADNA